MIAERARRIRLAGWIALAAIYLVPVACLARAEQDQSRRGGPPQVWAMLIGIEQYEDEGQFPACRGAAADALVMARWLIEDAGWGPDHVLLLIDREPSDRVEFRNPALRPESRKPTKDALDRGVSEWLTPRAKPGDVVLIFFAGQAVSLPPAGDGVGHPPRDYLIPCNGRDKEETWWRPGDAISGLAARGDVSVVCLLDTSPAGRIRPPRIDGKRLEVQVAPEHRLRMLEGIARWPGVTAWMAATEKTASETDEGRGLLTSAMIRALGTPGEALNLHACLHRLRRDKALAGLGFKTVGEFPLGLTVWPGHARHALPRVDPLLQRGHAERVTGVAFRSDGRMITASMDSTVRIWRASDSFLLNVLPWTSNGYWSLALGGDGRLLVAGGGQGHVLFYDTATETRLAAQGLRPHVGPVTQVAVLPDGHHVVSLDENQGRCAVWDVELSDGRIQQLRDPAATAGGFLLAAAIRPGAVAFALAVRDAHDRETIRLCESGGKVIKEFEIPAPAARNPGDPLDHLTALAVSPDGDRVVLGTDAGRVVSCDTHGARARPDLALPGGDVKALAIEPLWLMAGCGRSGWIITDKGEPTELPLEQPIEQVVASADGRRVAACGKQGRVKAWDVAADGRPQEIPLSDKVAGDGLSLAFSPGGDVLAVGDGSGQVRTWGIPKGEPRPEIGGSADRLGHLAVSPDGRSLLQVTWDRMPHSPGRATIWRIDGDRGTRPVPGRFLQAGGFLKGGRLVLVDESGDVVLHDGASLERLGVSFVRPRGEDGRFESRWKFTTLAISTDGKRVAAGSDDGPLACVWTTDDGRLVKTIRGHEDKVRAVAFSDDGRSIVTASDDGMTKIWDITGADPEPRRPGRIVPPPDPAGRGPLLPATAMALSPKDPPALAVGRSNGEIELWLPGEAKARRIGQLGGQVRTIAFSRDGRWLAAGGDDPRITLIDTADPGPRLPLATIRDGRRPVPHHFETIAALAFLPDGKLLASASMDSTVRLWSLDRLALVGTLASLDDGAEWVAYTPDGLFDGSRAAEGRVTWRLDPNWWPGEGDGLIARFDQLGPTYRRFDLADSLRQGKELDPPQFDSLAGPRLIVEPISAVGPEQREVILRIRSSTPDVKDLRLYHNGASLNLSPAGGLRRLGDDFEATVKLVHRKNEIYALGSRQANGLGLGGSPDSLSNRIELDCEENTPGRLHVLAIGISAYKAQALRYAHEDARAIAGFLQRKGLEGLSVSEPILLLDKEVTRDAVNDAFEELRGRVQGRPEDTVVIFLAGHATIRRGVFCLLLPDAVLPDRPLARDELVFRGPVGGDPPPALAPSRDRTVLTYSTIHAQLAFVEALQRLVIIDACQAEAIFDTIDNRRTARGAFHRSVDELSHRARTSYILATRRGERTAEPTELEHGLLTYALLRGMGDVGLRRPVGVQVFQQHPTADFNGNGWIEAEELKRYAGLTLPVLADRFQGASRGNESRADPSAAPERPASIASDVDPSASFRIIAAPRGAQKQVP